MYAGGLTKRHPQTTAYDLLGIDMAYVAVLLGLLAVAIVIAVLARRSVRPHSVVEASRDAVALDPDLRRFIVAINTVNAESDAAYRDAVGQLREKREVVVRAIEVLDAKSIEPDYALRRGLILAATALEHESALPYLRKIAMEPLPQRAMLAREVDSAIEETAVRGLAVEGIERLASNGSAPALHALVDATNTTSLTVRALAFAGLRAADTSGQRLGMAIESLPAAQRYLSEFRRVDVAGVPQIADPRRHLARTERGLVGPPLLPEDAGRAPPRPPATGRDDSPNASSRK